MTYLDVEIVAVSSLQCKLLCTVFYVLSSCVQCGRRHLQSTPCCSTSLYWGVVWQHMRQSPGVRRSPQQAFERAVTRGPLKIAVPMLPKSKVQESNKYAKGSGQTALPCGLIERRCLLTSTKS